MANEEQLSILNQGVEVWNRWRTENNDAEIDLTGARLDEAQLRGVNFERARLSKAILTRAVLWGSNLDGADLSESILIRADLRAVRLIEATLNEAVLREAILTGAFLNRANLNSSDLNGAKLFRADLSEASLSGSYLTEAHLGSANLSEANLTGAYLRRANLSGANLLRSNFFKTEIGDTIFGSSDLSEIMGLEDVIHVGPSEISTSAFIQSKGKIPDAFLRGCGLSDWEIGTVKLYNPDLSNDERNKFLYKIYDLQASQAIQISPLFISYSHADSEFVNKIEGHLNKKGIRFWRDIHDMKAGRIEKQIDSAISQGRSVLLILSEHSLGSDWVEHEVRTARGLEKEMGRDVLCPVALDDSWKSSRWPKRIMEQIMEYNILDFSAWEDDGKFDGMFRKLIEGLELFYKG